MNSKKHESRDEKIAEILAILGELYQRLGNGAAHEMPMAVRPYPHADPHAWAREVAAAAQASPWATYGAPLETLPAFLRY